MNKHLIVIGVVIILLAVGLSGCNQNTTSNNNSTSEIEIVSHKIEDKGYMGWKVSGTIKNIADRNIDKVTIRVRFYDSDNELLITKTDTVSYLANGETADFEVYYGDWEQYYDQYDHYTIFTSP